MTSNEIESKEPSWVRPKFAREDIWSWDKNHHSDEVTISGKHSHIAHFHPSWSSGTAGVRGTRNINNNVRHYWELVISRRIFGTSMMFGIGTKKARLHEDSFVNLVGIDDQSWGLSHKGLLWHNGNWSYYTKPFRENVATRIGVLFDGTAGTLTYYKDGKCLGVAFKGLSDIKEQLFPIVCSTAAKTEMVLEHMTRDYEHLQDRCRAVIGNNIKCKQDIDELELPPNLESYLHEEIDCIVEPLKLVRQTLNYLESNFLTTIPKKN